MHFLIFFFLPSLLLWLSSTITVFVYYHCNRFTAVLQLIVICGAKPVIVVQVDHAFNYLIIIIKIKIIITIYKCKIYK